MGFRGYSFTGDDMSAIIVMATLGNRDLQIVAIKEGQLCRVPPLYVGEVHSQLAEGQLPYEWWFPAKEETPFPELERDDQPALEWIDGVCHFRRRGEGWPRPATAADLGLPEPERSRLFLVPGLLWKHLHHLKAALDDGQRLHRILLFHTSRDRTSKRGKREPHATAPLLKEWLPGFLGHKVDRETIQIVDCLRGTEDLKVANEQGAVFVRPVVSERIVQAVHQAAAECPTACVWLHEAGGIPELSEMVRSAAQLFFPALEYRTPLEDLSDKPEEVRGLRHTAVEELSARRRVRDLVGGGEFQAAAVLSDGFDTVWARGVRAAARYFQGYMTDARRLAEALPTGATRGALLPLLTGTWPQAFHVALRAEAALRADDPLSGASLTVTFHDVALFDGVDAALRRNPNDCCIDWKKREIIRDRFAPTLEQIHRAAGSVGKLAPWVRGFSPKDVNDWFSWEQLRAHLAWQEQVLIRLMGEVGGRSDLEEALRNLSQALHEPSTKGNIPADFRNVIIHSLPTEQELRLTAQLFETRPLWWRPTGRPRSLLAPQVCGQAVLKALGVADAAGHYENLTAALVADVTQG